MDLQLFAENDIPKQSSISLKRGISSFQRRIAEHEAYIQDPKSHCPDWESKNEYEKKGLIRHWKKEIGTFERSIEERIDELKKRGEWNE